MPQRFNFCPICGHKLIVKTVNSIERNVCSSCERINFENPIVGAAAIILNEHNQILLVQRAPDVTYPGLWCIPCGYVEYNEDIRVAVVREVKEETGLDVMCGEVFDVHSNFHNPNQHTVGVWFCCTVIGGQAVAGDDASEVAWFDLEHPPRLAFPTDYLILNKLVSSLCCKNK